MQIAENNSIAISEVSVSVKYSLDVPAGLDNLSNVASSSSRVFHLCGRTP